MIGHDILMTVKLAAHLVEWQISAEVIRIPEIPVKCPFLASVQQEKFLGISSEANKFDITYFLE